MSPRATCSSIQSLALQLVFGLNSLTLRLTSKCWDITKVNFEISNYLNHSLSAPNQLADFVENFMKLVCCVHWFTWSSPVLILYRLLPNTHLPHSFMMPGPLLTWSTFVLNTHLLAMAVKKCHKERTIQSCFKWIWWAFHLHLFIILLIQLHSREP